MKIKIKVTKEILEASKMCNSDVGINCAISHAVRDIFPNAWVSYQAIFPFHVKNNDYSWEYMDEHLHISLPRIAREFAVEFDKGNSDARAKMEAMSFEIDVPSEIIDMIGLSEVHRILKESKTLELV